MRIYYPFILFLLCLSAVACTPKVSAPVTANEPAVLPPAPIDESLSPCPKFSDAPDPDAIETQYVLYRDFLRAGDWAKSMAMWREVFAVAPAADGKRNSVFADGIMFYEYLVSQTPDADLRNHYVDSIFLVYDQIQECYPEGGYVDGRKAFDLYYKYPERSSKMEVYQLFKKAIDTDTEKVPDFVINPFAALLTELYDTSAIDQVEAKKYADILLTRIETGLEKAKTSAERERWEVIAGYAPQRLEYFETVRDFYDCNYYVEKYYPEFVENATDCDVIRTVYSRLRWGNCEEGRTELTAVAEAGNTNCVVASTGPASQGYNALREGDYSQAINLFQQAADETDDAERKGNFLLTIAKIYYAHLKNFSRARSYARQAAGARSGWGEPYILIGRLYASSGPLCGPGRGWDSQVVVWAAIDMWNQAKRVDAGAAAEANKWIGRYRQYMPNGEDVFMRKLKEGDSFYIGCWIQETTTIRTS
jgi:tetratricopeptide (TPR) repeat protein